MRRATTAGGLIVVAALALVTGCSQLPTADESYRQKIPAALESADLGLADTWADSSLSGFTETLVIGGTVTSLGDPDASLLDEPATVEIDDSLVRRIVRIAVAERTMSFAYVRLALEDAAGDDIDVAPALTRLGADPLSNGRIDMEEAERIAEGAEGDGR